MSSRGSMVFRVELSEQAQRDIAAIYDWLQSQQAGEFVLCERGSMMPGLIVLTNRP